MNERALFESALKITEPSARQTYLDETCADNPALRARVDALLQSHASAGSFLEMPLVNQQVVDVKLVAIKVMNPQLAATSPPRKRFLQEAQAAAAVRHANVVQVHSVEEKPLPYLVMEYIDGQTLQEKLDRVGPLEIAELIHIGQQIQNS